MVKILFKIILPLALLSVWICTCYWICKEAGGFNYFLFWVMTGWPFGTGKLSALLVPGKFGIAGGLGLIALNCVIGGMIGGIALVFKLLTIVRRIVGCVTGSFWNECISG